MTSLLNQPTGLFADPREAWLANLLDPRVGHRSAILPLVEVGGDDTGRGSVEFGAPQFLVDMLKSAMLPGAAAQGYQPAPEEVTQMAMDTMLGGGLLGRAPSGALGMNLWHGGPHRWAAEPDFPHGRPRLDKMGTGEGNQAYGHGFYSAETPGVAQTYKTPEGSYKRLSGHLDPKTEYAFDLMERGHSTSDIMGMMLGKYGGNISFDEVVKAIDGARDVGAGQGSLYKLDIPDADVAKYLDWDAPLSEQPDRIKKIAAHYGVKTTPSGMKEARGSDLYRAIASAEAKPPFDSSTMNPGSVEASEALRKAGIPGLKYFDGSSRGKGEGTRNYVTWDQEVLDRSKILERDGEALND